MKFLATGITLLTLVFINLGCGKPNVSISSGTVKKAVGSNPTDIPSDLSGCQLRVENSVQSFREGERYPLFKFAIRSEAGAICHTPKIESVTAASLSGETLRVEAQPETSVYPEILVRIIGTGVIKVRVRLASSSTPTNTVDLWAQVQVNLEAKSDIPQVPVRSPLPLLPTPVPVHSPIPWPSTTVPYLVADKGEKTSNSNSVETILQLPVPAVVDLSGYVRATYYRPEAPGNAGVNAAISVDGVFCSSRFSFEGESSNITFSSNATCLKYLAAGSHRVKVYDSLAGSYSLSGYYSSLQYVAYAVTVSDLFGELRNPGASVSTTFETYSPVILHLSGYVSGTYQSSVVSNAGVIAALSVNGKTCGQGQSFEGSSYSITFNANASCVLYLDRGIHTLRAYDQYFGSYPNMERGRIAKLQWFARPIRPEIQYNSVSTTGSVTTTTFTTYAPHVVDISGTTYGTYYSPGNPQNAGINSTIFIDGRLCSQDFSFEGSSYSIGFSANSKCIRALAPGTHTISVKNTLAGSYPNMSAFRSQLDYSLTLDLAP